MMKLINKVKKFFFPYSNMGDKEFEELEENVHKIMDDTLQKEVDKQLDLLMKDVKIHVDRRIEALLKARAAARTPQGKKSYNGTIKELRTIKEML